MRISSITVTSRSKKPAPTRRLELGGLPSIPSFFFFFFFYFVFLSSLYSFGYFFFFYYSFSFHFSFFRAVRTRTMSVFRQLGFNITHSILSLFLSISPFTIRFSIVYGEKFFFVFFFRERETSTGSRKVSLCVVV